MKNMAVFSRSKDMKYMIFFTIFKLIIPHVFGSKDCLPSEQLFSREAENSALQGHVIKTENVTSVIECALLCSSLMPDCKSLNYVSQSEAGICEINHKRKDKANVDFVQRQHSQYFEILDDTSNSNKDSDKNYFTDGEWVLIARFSNNDSAHWMADSGSWWYDKEEVYGKTHDPSDNHDMISEAFWQRKALEFKITQSNDSKHTALLRTAGECLNYTSFRDKMKSYGIFRNSDQWAVDECKGNCSVVYDGDYLIVDGFKTAQSDGDIQSKSNIGFWCHVGFGDGSVLMIGGGGIACERADHGIGITEENDAGMFQTPDREFDFGNDAFEYPTTKYSLNLWVR